MYSLFIVNILVFYLIFCNMFWRDFFFLLNLNSIAEKIKLMAHFRSLPREESPLHHKLQGLMCFLISFNFIDSSSSRSSTLQEIGSQAVWSLSSAKPGFGIEQLRDNNLETYWQ